MDYIICKDTSKFKDKHLGTGTTAECFLTKDKRVYKEFNKTVLEKHYDNIVRLSDLEIDSFVFPQTLVFSEAPSHETIQGYLMRYSKGIDIAHVSSLVYMRDFLKALAKLEEDIKLLSKSKMDIYDLKGANVLYTNDNRINVIDTDFYVYSPGLLEEDLNEINTMELEYLLSAFFIKERQERLKNPKLLSMYESFSDGKESAVKYMSALIEEIERETRENVETYGDFRSGIQHVLRAKK